MICKQIVILFFVFMLLSAWFVDPLVLIPEAQAQSVSWLELPDLGD